MDTGHDLPVRHRRCRGAALGLAEDGAPVGWPAGELLLASAPGPSGPRFLLSTPDTALDGDRLTSFLDRVAPFGCPVPGSLMRAYALPDAPFPSVLLREHEAALEGVGDAYGRFLADGRRRWIAALAESGPGLCPTLVWQSGPDRRFLTSEEWRATLDATGVALEGEADHYLGRGLLLLAQPHLAESWPKMMSLGGVTKIRKITGREFPVWVDLAAHQPSLLASPLLNRVEQLLAAG